MERELTAKEVECLNAVARAGLAGASPWDFGSSTVSVLKRRGLIVPIRVNGATRYVSKANAAKAAEGAA